MKTQDEIRVELQSILDPFATEYVIKLGGNRYKIGHTFINYLGSVEHVVTGWAVQWLPNNRFQSDHWLYNGHFPYKQVSTYKTAADALSALYRAHEAGVYGP